ncbi:MAG: DNA polymerase/3'-5' exonuclease PolX [Syntrophorhabdaceae bacterium PtaU1.Bin034]|jgi:DNA polymerase (family 10)|nr:MAG: DNA polymerase/3'-5' exonuclease PolX [Syntrophorhabdaceae bacterium PtaU1.Bin034]
MQQRSIPAILEEIGALLEIEGENTFKVKAYYNAARIIAGLDNFESIVKQGRLREIKGIGETLAAKIIEYSETGKIAYHEELKQKFPLGLLELLGIPNLGPKKIKVLYEQLGITTMGELEYACKENRLIGLFRFGEKTQEKILKGIDFFKRHKGEFLFGEVYPLATKLRERFSRMAPEGLVEVCGSVRRKKEIVRDIDLLVAGDEWAGISRQFTSMPGVEEVLVEGETKTSVRLASGLEADLRVVSTTSFPYALIYFTGSKEHNVKLRGIAKRRNLKLNEYGLFEGERFIALEDENAIYHYLGLSFIPPELREDMGEIEAAQNGNLPQLVEMKDIKGTLHVHTDMSDGSDDLEAIANVARELGLSYVGISDHSKSAYYAGGLKADDVLRQWEAIDRFNEANQDFCFFKGIESDILPDGSLDYEDDLLAGFDFVIASVHSAFTMTQVDMERRIMRAMENPHVTVLGHPTGRLLLAREGYRVDMRTIIDAAAEHKVVIELNASPYRLDIDWRYMKQAKEKGVKIAINPDAHSAKGLAELVYGLGIARKGWLEPGDVLNSKNSVELREFFRRVKNEKRH